MTDPLIEDYAAAKALFTRALELAELNSPRGLTYDQTKLEPYYYLGLIALNGWDGNEPSCDGAVEMLSHAARHTLWLASEGPTSLYGQLQAALRTYDAGHDEEARRRYE